jgi:hypothetical protein
MLALNGLGIDAVAAHVTAQAIGVSTFVGSIGINTHIDFNGSGYQNLSAVIAAINYLGVKNLRDSAGKPGDVGVDGSWQRVANATGAKFDAFMNNGAPDFDSWELQQIPQLARQGILNFVEGGNENDSPYSLGLGNSLGWTAEFQPKLYALAHLFGLPVINMSFGAGWTAANNWRGHYGDVGDLSPYADYANAHTYPVAGQTPEFGIRTVNNLALLAAAGRPVITTEIGWQTNATDSVQAAKYTLDAVFDGINAGNVKTYLYALFNDGSGDWGLMNHDGTTKPAGAALHNLTIILADKGNPHTDRFSYRLAGTTRDDRMLLLEKSNGAFDLALWNEVDAPHPVTVTLEIMAKAIILYDPLISASATRTEADTEAITLTVPDYPVIVEILPSNADSSYIP